MRKHGQASPTFVRHIARLCVLAWTLCQSASGYAIHSIRLLNRPQGNAGESCIDNGVRSGSLQRSRQACLTLERRAHHRRGHVMLMGFPVPFLREKETTADARVRSSELYEMLTSSGGKVDDQAVIAKIEELEAVSKSVNKARLYDGPWRVVWKSGTSWQRYFDPFTGLADNRAYQWYKKDGSLVSIAQALGEDLYVSVDAEWSPGSKSSELSYELDVAVLRGWLHSPLGRLPLDFIKGNGKSFVTHIDSRLRVLRSGTGGVVVQVKAGERELAGYVETTSDA